MKTSLALPSAAALACGLAAAPAHAQNVVRIPAPVVVDNLDVTGGNGRAGNVGVIDLSLLSPWRCRRWDLSPCTQADMADRSKRQILVTSSGYTAAERSAFFADFETIVTQMSNTGTVWSTQKREQLLYVGYFTGGGPLGTPTAFEGRVFPHPIRGHELTAKNRAVMTKVAELRSTTLPNLRPMGVLVVLNTLQDGITANATPPSFTQGDYGIARVTRKHLESPLATTHELAHTALSFVDEYVEEGFENLDIRTLDVLTPLLRLNGWWSGLGGAVADLLDVYDLRLSEILADNGNGNISTRSEPSTVSTPGFARELFPSEGGFSFGRGTYHAPGKNLMDRDTATTGSLGGFAWAHSAGQQKIIETAFGAAPYRPNDRLRNAGPSDGWSENGGSPVVVLHDADKHDHFHPTESYDVLIGWTQREWYVEWNGGVPVPNYRDVWVTATKTASASAQRVELPLAPHSATTNLLVSALCSAGLREAPQADGTLFPLCEASLDSISSAAPPVVPFRVPYQTVTVPAQQHSTTYWWAFKANQKVLTSGYTGWSSFYRNL